MVLTLQPLLALVLVKTVNPLTLVLVVLVVQETMLVVMPPLHLLVLGAVVLAVMHQVGSITLVVLVVLVRQVKLLHKLLTYQQRQLQPLSR